jgi:hypothetical protein
MQKNIKWANKELPGVTHEDLLEITISNISKKENGLLAATQVNCNQGKINAESGHMSNIQKIGCSIGGTISGNNKTIEYLTEISKLGNQVNIEKHGIPIIGENLITGECWEYPSIGEAERDTNVQSAIITKILRGKQPKTRSGWTFYKK